MSCGLPTIALEQLCQVEHTTAVSCKPCVKPFDVFPGYNQTIIHISPPRTLTPHERNHRITWCLYRKAPTRQLLTVAQPLLSLEVATPKNTPIYFQAVTLYCKPASQAAITVVGCSSLLMPLSPQHLTALDAIDVCLVGETPTSSVPALYGCGGLWPYDYGHT